MKILRLSRARVLLWARERGGEAFEVSKVVGHPLQPLCPTAPRCPEEIADAGLEGRPAWVDPTEPPQGSCPYHFEVRGECLRHRNQVALEAALFCPTEVRLTERLLVALGYTVTEESIDPIRGASRILKAHGHIGSNHQIRLLKSPSAGQIVLVREMRRAQAPRGRTPLRVLPVMGGNR